MTTEAIQEFHRGLAGAEAVREKMHRYVREFDGHDRAYVHKERDQPCSCIYIHARKYICGEPTYVAFHPEFFVGLGPVGLKSVTRQYYAFARLKLANALRRARTEETQQ